MSKPAEELGAVATDLGSVWLRFSLLMGIAAGAATAAFVFLSPAIAIAVLILKIARTL
ncbi:MAG: hypothetical protein KGL35_08250 [Bradyrhizobium sp.]|nr:hypothetical protein [Bradyrhizobium sp.]